MCVQMVLAPPSICSYNNTLIESHHTNNIYKAKLLKINL